MTEPSPGLSSFSSMLRLALGDLLDPTADDFVSMMHPDAIMAFPYAPPGTPGKLQGREPLVTHLTRLSVLIKLDSFSAQRVHRTLQDGVVILEFSCTGRGIETGEAYDQDYISVITTQGGRITRYVDYWNPLIVLRAVGGEAALAAALTTEVQNA